ncbi:MAG: hypothetical protein ACR2I2_18945 [Bryobacteraceae bacterium]
MVPSSGTERWQLLNTLFEQALDLEPARRRAFIDETCGGDADLRREIDSLLEAAGDSSDFIAASVQLAARDLCAETAPRRFVREPAFPITR